MIYLQIALFFLLLPNVLLLFLLKLGYGSIGKKSILLISYGLAPLLSGLLFYYLIQLWPRMQNGFYVIAILVIWLGLFIFSRAKISEAKDIYASIGKFVLFKRISAVKKVVIALVFIFTIIFSIQAFIYPVVENDSAYYYVNSEAFYQTRDAGWSKAGFIDLRGLNEYPYNPMVRPGIPASISLLFTFGHSSQYLIFNFFFVYYYYLLLLTLLLLARRLANDLKKNVNLAMFFAFIFFVFYWNMTRFYIFNNKEVVIFFLALIGVYLTCDLLAENKRQIKKELLLGSVIGFNAFINYHGTVIGIFLALIILIFSKLTFWQRAKQVLVIFASHLIFSSFEFINTFGVHLWNLIKIVFHLGPVAPQVLSGDESLRADHIEMYQANSFTGMYLKGKLQLITGVGSYGFYFLAFLAILFKKFKSIKSSLVGKVVLALIAVYYLAVIDPFNLNRSNLSVVLWGSPKYSMFVVLLSLIFVAVYFESITKSVFNFLYKNKITISLTLFLVAGIFLFVKTSLVSIGVSALLNVIEANREIGFYVGKITTLYYIAATFIVLTALALALFNIKKIKKAEAFKVALIAATLLMIAPFFIVDPGKVPLYKTLSYIDNGQEEMAKNVIYFGDEFKVYYYAKSILPQGTSIRTGFTELYTQNDYFKLMNVNDKGSEYEILGSCPGEKEIFSAGVYRLCQRTLK